MTTPTTPAAEAVPTHTVALDDQQKYELRLGPVVKRIGQHDVQMLAYNGSIPGPTLNVTQGTQAVVHITNDTETPTLVHWHGLRLDNRYDGTHLTQEPIAAGGQFTAVLEFPDPGLYWYHPHIRSDHGLEMGLYGTILVQPDDPEYWPAAHREVVLTLDDLLLADGQVAPFDPGQPTHVAMGRFGDVLLVNGDREPTLSAQPGEVVRLYLVNTANTRVFNVAIPGARMKLVGGDSGHVEHEEFVDGVVIAPSERAVIDVLFDQAASLRLEHRTPERTHVLAHITVAGPRALPALDDTFATLRTNADMTEQRRRIMPYLSDEPDKTLSLLAEMNLPAPETDTSYVCPMHPDVTSDAPGSCPECGMKLVAASLVSAGGGDDQHHDHDSAQDEQGQGESANQAHAESRSDGEHEVFAGVEWEDDMVAVNRITTSENMHWKLVDQASGAENTDIDWTFRVGDQIKLRLVNELAGDHPMHHPFHIHGAGRFLVLSRDGTPEPNLVWKDTVLVRTGEVVDLLLDVTHAGAWMAHCHIAEHHEANMMLTFTVTA